MYDYFRRKIYFVKKKQEILVFKLLKNIIFSFFAEVPSVGELYTDFFGPEVRLHLLGDLQAEK